MVAGKKISDMAVQFKTPGIVGNRKVKYIKWESCARQERRYSMENIWTSLSLSGSLVAMRGRK